MKPGSMLARADRWRRRCGFDANDLRRDVDRAQWRIGLVLLTLFLAVAPPLAVHTAQAVYDIGKRNARQEAATWRPVTATVVDAEGRRGGYQVTVTWVDPDGTQRTGNLTSWTRVDAGDQVEAWAGPDAVTFVPPSRRGRTVISTAAAGAGVVLAVGSPLFITYRLVRRRFDRRRERLWDAAWARLHNHHIGP